MFGKEAEFSVKKAEKTIKQNVISEKPDHLNYSVTLVEEGYSVCLCVCLSGTELTARYLQLSFFNQKLVLKL